MCGIAGIINWKGISSQHREQLRSMTEAVSHRGPDAEGFYYSKYVCFGHKRLSIVDLSPSSNQPMRNESERIVVVFNGEIYNHIELREELKKEYCFSTDHSDTEAIIHAYSKWGISALNRLNGMFAIAIYDVANKRVYLARDRLGEKPIYYVQSNESVYFASEIKAFFSAGVTHGKADSHSIYNYLTFLTTNAPETFFEKIKKLESGHYLEISDGRMIKTKYWDVADYINEELTDDFETACLATDKILRQSIRRRNLADVPITVATSGGLDSSINLFYSRRYNPGLSGINLSYVVENASNERQICERYCRESHVPLVCEIVDQIAIRNAIDDYLSTQIEMPLGSPDSCLFYLIARAMKRNSSKVLIVGEGGDEIGGYPIYSRLLKEYRLLRTLKVGLLSQLRLLAGGILRRYDVFFEGRIISRRHIHGFGEREKRSFWLGERDYNSYAILDGYMKEIRDDLADSYLRKILNIEYKVRLPELLLPRLDYASMSVGVEARAPFLDHELVEYSAGLPFSLKMKQGAKTILKTISADNLPQYILTHPKIGFGSFMAPFLEDELPKWFSEKLLMRDASLHQYIRKDYLHKLHNDHLYAKNRGYEMWILYVLDRWLDKVALG